ncbi:hypothetical protein L9Z73_21750 [Pseudomonas sp. TNT11]|uniref:Uncharacterized protein n=1 Tax=Pseudomonas emilianonis TaxID=2915812 RepID=A0ABT0EMB7_9PSED|nr:hypothetical protein [Pseudomonas emilianonis]MCK1786872.1 hypothetical protein [Pseudomonas emilianonis]
MQNYEESDRGATLYVHRRSVSTNLSLARLSNIFALVYGNPDVRVKADNHKWFVQL